MKWSRSSALHWDSEHIYMVWGKLVTVRSWFTYSFTGKHICPFLRPQFWLYMLQCTITLIWLELSWMMPYKYKLACQCVYKTKLVHTLSVTYGNFPHLIHLYSPCLHHSTSAQQCNSRPCSGTPCLSIYACLPWKEHTGSYTITNTVGMNKGLACSGLGEPLCVCTHHTVHHCCPHSRCRHHSARGCEYSSRFDSETRPPHTPWELCRQKKVTDFRTPYNTDTMKRH